MKLEWHNTHGAHLWLNAVTDLLSEADKVISGKVDATIHGRYFGDALSSEQKQVLQRLALSVTASRIFEHVEKLVPLDITLDDDYGNPLRTASDVETFLHRKLEAAIDATA